LLTSITIVELALLRIIEQGTVSSIDQTTDYPKAVYNCVQTLQTKGGQLVFRSFQIKQ